MISECPENKREKLLPIFKNQPYLNAIAEGLIIERIGYAYADNIESPNIAMIGQKILCFLGGNEENENVSLLLEKIPQGRLIFVSNEKWATQLKNYFGEKLKNYPRTKFSSKNLKVTEMQELQKKLPKNMQIKKLTKNSIERISEQAKGIISILFHSIDDFLERNFGFYIEEKNNVASLALAATPIYDNSFEIHIETNPNYQRKGLATIICAKLIEYSLQNNLEPHWDADNEPSAKLAIKLGYTNPEKYFAYYWIGEKK